MIFKRNKPPQGEWFSGWLEFHLQWLVENFDKEILSRSVTLPGDSNAEVARPPTENNLQQVTDYIASKFDVNPRQFRVVSQSDNRFAFELVDVDEELREIFINSPIHPHDPLHDIVKRVSLFRILTTIPEHGLALEDLEAVVELFAILRGFGIGMANESSVSRDCIVYLAADDVAAAIALVEYAKGESRQIQPPWTNRLKLEAANAMLRTLRYLRTTTPYFGPDTIYQRKTQPNAMRFMELMRSPRSVDQVIALEWIYPKLATSEVSVDFIIEALKDSNRWVKLSASRALSHFVNHTQDPIPNHIAKILVKMLEDRNEQVKANAAQSLSKLELNMPIVSTLCRYIMNSDQGVAYAAISALVNSHDFTSIVIPKITKALTFYMARGEDAIVENLIHVLDELCEFPEEHLVAALDLNEHDFLFSATDILREIRYAKKQALAEEEDPGHVIE